MRVFVAGASGAIGRPLVRELLSAGHGVTGMTRRPEHAEEIRAAGAEAVVSDALDLDAVAAAIAEAQPEVVVNELTSLGRDYDPRRLSDDFYAATNRIRKEGGANLLAAAHATGTQRFVTQSVAFFYAPVGEMVKDEKAPVVDPEQIGPAFAEGVRVVRNHERAVLEAEGLEALVLRYGWFYGPDTYYARDGSIAELVRQRRFPVIGGAEGRFSFVHVEDAAAATAAACERGASGIYNVVDDEPATSAQWLPPYAEALGAKRPWRVPGWVGRLVGGSAGRFVFNLRGASNEKAKRELGWQPRYPSWRQGFREALG